MKTNYPIRQAINGDVIKILNTKTFEQIEIDLNTFEVFKSIMAQDCVDDSWIIDYCNTNNIDKSDILGFLELLVDVGFIRSKTSG